MSFDQDPNESAQISGSDFAQMCDEIKRLRTELAAVTAERDNSNRLYEQAVNNQITGGGAIAMSITSNHSLVSCWDCNSTGILALARFNTDGVEIPCDRCNGTGECPAVMREWQLLGAAYKEDRRRNERTLREEAKLRGYGVVELSKAERGIIDPCTLKTHNNQNA